MNDYSDPERDETDHLLPSVRDGINKAVASLYLCDGGALGGLLALRKEAAKLAQAVEEHAATKAEIVDALLATARVGDIVKELGEDVVVTSISSALDLPVSDGEPPFIDDAPLVGELPKTVVLQHLPPLTISEWEARDLAPPDCLMGDWLTTTTRALLVAPTGLGKTNFAMALAIHAASGANFLHWQGRRAARVLYIDGEMARRLYRQRIADAVNRLGARPEGFYALSREDLEEMPPLNTPAGQAMIMQIIDRIGGVDLIVFDSIMCLLGGDMKDGEPWAAVMPWVRALTKRNIGQLWVHHTGHDASRSYGDKTKEWQLDTVLHMEPVENADAEADVCFNLEFRKARERTPTNRADFTTTKVTLAGDEWQSTAGAAQHQGHVSQVGMKFLGALLDALAGDTSGLITAGRPATTAARWKAEAARLGLIDPADKPDSARSLFAKYRRELIAANRIACNNDTVWTL